MRRLALVFLGGAFAGAVAGGLLVRLYELFARTEASAGAYGMVMVLTTSTTVVFLPIAMMSNDSEPAP